VGPPAPAEDDPFLVTLKGREHINPHTWNPAYRWFLTALGGVFVLNATFASSAPSQLLPSIIGHFHVSQEVGILTIALFVAGYCVGPLFWGPLSERYGRKWVFAGAFLPYTAFQVGSALSPNIGALLAFRFLGGCFAASPLTNSGGVIADLWQADQRGVALAIFALAPFAGPAIAPIVSGALEVTGSDWRWIFWILTIFAGACLVAILVLLPETYVPTLLRQEAKRLRKETGDDRWYTAAERASANATFKQTLKRTVLKPFIMIVQEPMLFVMTMYLSFIYGIVYLLFEAVPIIFQQYHHWNPIHGALAFLGLPIGGTTGVLLYIFYYNPKYMAKHRTKKGQMVPPEERLKPLMLAAPLFAVSFFWSKALTQDRIHCQGG
jgi:multidrug resistance protein